MKDSIKAGELNMRELVFQLRLGNLLNYKGEICSVETISLDMDDESEPFMNLYNGRKMHEYIVPHHQRPGDLSPIPLSKEVLKKIPEFREDNYGLWILHSEYSSLVHKPLLWIKWVNAEGGGYWDVCVGEALDKLSNVNHIQNLHELQNIAFAFGKELEITL